MVNLTPQCLVELVILGLYWEHWPPKLCLSRTGTQSYRAGWTTVDHVMKVLLGIGVITEAQIKMVQHKTKGIEHQRKLSRHCGTSYGGAQVTNRDSLLQCQGQKINLLRLVRNQHLEILASGVSMAAKLEGEYADTVPKVAYLAEAERIKTFFKTEGASAAASSLYRERIEQELNVDE